MLVFQKLRQFKALQPYAGTLDQLEQYAYLIRLNRPIGAYLLLWPTLWALWIAAGGFPDPWILFVFVAGVFLMRSAGCAINDFADRDIDPHVERTRDRPLAAGKITTRETLAVFGVLVLLAFILVLTLNRLTIYLSAVGLVLAITYPFMKRFHYMPQVHLGAAFGWAVPMAFTAQTDSITPITWLLFIAAVLWSTIYDTMYAMADREDDLKIGVKSTAILFGEADRLIVGVLQILMLLDLYFIGRQVKLGLFYDFSLMVAAGLFAWQQILIYQRKPADCFKAFLNNNWLGMAVFIGILVDLWVHQPGAA